MSVAFSKWHVTRATGVPVIAYRVMGTGQLLIIFLIGGLSWLLVKWQILLLSLFSKHEQEQQSGKIFENVLIMKQNNLGEKSVAHIKLTFCFQIQVHGIEENIERQHLASLALMKTLKIDVHWKIHIGPK